MFSASCSSQKIHKDLSSKIHAEHLETIDAEPFIVRIQDEDSSKIMSLKLKYSGTSGLEEDLKNQQDSVQNLVISVLSKYKLNDLKSSSGKKDFQKNILISFSEFITENKFVRVDLVELKEI